VPVNDPPVLAASEYTYNTPEDVRLVVTAATGLPSNAADVDSSTLTVAASSQPAHGLLEIDEAIGSFRYTPDSDFYGQDGFTFAVQDGAGGAATAHANITVGECIGAPAKRHITCPSPAHAPSVQPTLTYPTIHRPHNPRCARSRRPPLPASFDAPSVPPNQIVDVKASALAALVTNPEADALELEPQGNATAAGGTVAAVATSRGRVFRFTPSYGFDGSAHFHVQEAGGGGGSSAMTTVMIGYSCELLVWGLLP
jgi:hypothetical protein